MHINEKGFLVIDDPYICEFISINKSDDFLKSFETIIKNICLIHHERNNQTSDLASQLNAFKKELIQNISDQVAEKVDLSKVITHENNKLSIIQHTLENITSKIEKQDIKKTTNKYKGDQGEDFVFSSLEKILTQRDGFTIKKTNTIANNCDIRISKLGHNDISLEIKAYQNSVGTIETRKFENDIIGLNTHGIFISLHSGICSKGQIEFDKLPTGKFAIYISNNNDMDIIKEYILLLFKFDTLCNFDDDFSINQESIMDIKRYLDSQNNKISFIKTNMKTCMTALNELSMDYIENVLLKNTIKSTKAICIICGQEFSSKGLTNHMNFCKKKEKIEEKNVNNICTDSGIIKL